MALTEASTYEEAVTKFIAAADWLSDVDLPGVMTLRTLARHLDGVEVGKLPQAALVSQFNMAFRDLRSRAPKSGGAGDDPLGEAMRQVDLFTAAAEKFEAEHGG
jgi:hypothetical protein